MRDINLIRAFHKSAQSRRASLELGLCEDLPISSNFMFVCHPRIGVNPFDDAKKYIAGL
jgi:hypothetical protein